MRVSKLLSINTTKINKELSDLNAFADDPIEFGTVASPVSDIYRELNGSTLSSRQQHGVELLSLLRHAEEEKLSIKEELIILTRYLHQQSQAIRGSIQTLIMSDSD